MKELWEGYKKWLIGAIVVFMGGYTTSILSTVVFHVTYADTNIKLDSLQEQKLRKHQEMLSNCESKKESQKKDSLMIELITSISQKLDKHIEKEEKGKETLLKTLYRVLGRVESIDGNIKYPILDFGMETATKEDTVLPANENLNYDKQESYVQIR